jgi:pimeloyl-ACP methyl ester carboxylesterase
MKDSFLQGPGIAYRTNEFLPTRPTLVFIHGLSGSCSAWAQYEQALENTYNLVTYDLRGHGLSKKYTRYQDYNIGLFADDLNTLLNQLNIQTCTLIAHSMGTTLALSFLHSYPGKAKSVLFLAPNYKQHTESFWLTRVLLAVSTSAYALLPFSPKQGRRIDYTNFGYSPDISLKRIVPEITDMTLRLYLYCLRQLYAFTNDRWWKEIQIPTTIMHGTKDTFVPYRLGVELAKEIPNAKLITLTDANHMLVLNNKKEILEVIKNLPV